ncbi:extracellular solute-binding protein [Ruminococcaceae bacterium OttesenSCG-928-D13]|nr:extracellular solute-binding protein [Ruminococcaceae bacterium OttesenSCG-928-D13]
MKKHIFRTLAILLCLMLALAGCGTPSSSVGTGAESEPAASAGGGESGTEPAAEADPFGKYEEPIKLTAVRILESNVKFEPGNPERDSVDQNVWQTAYLEQLGIELEYIWTPNAEQYSQKWNVAIASGDIPDIAVVDETLYKQLVDGDLVEDMTQVYEAYASEEYKAANTNDNGATINYMTFDGKLLGLPQTGSQPDNANMMFIRKDWLDQVDMEVPKTLDDLVEVVKAFQQAGLGGSSTVGIAVSKDINGGINELSGIMNGMGAYYDQWVENDGKLAYSSTLPAMRDALLKLQEMYADGMFVQDFAVKDASQSGEDVVAGRCGITFGTFWAPLNSIGSNITEDENAEWIVADLPTVDGTPYTTQANAAPSGYIFVRKGIEHPEAVVKLINLGFKLNNEDNQKYGISEDNVEIFKYRFAFDVAMPWKNLNTWNAVKTALDTGATDGMTADDLNAFNSVQLSMEGDRSQDAYTLVFGPDSTFEMINELKEQDRIVVNSYQSLPTETMVAKWLDLQNTMDAAILNVVMGADISTFDQAVEDWNASGGSQITDEVNAWYASK